MRYPQIRGCSQLQILTLLPKLSHFASLYNKGRGCIDQIMRKNIDQDAQMGRNYWSKLGHVKPSKYCSRVDWAPVTCCAKRAEPFSLATDRRDPSDRFTTWKTVKIG